NYLLRKVIKGLHDKKDNPHQKIVKEKLMLIASLLIERCPKVREIAEKHQFYGNHELQTKYHRPLVSPSSIYLSIDSPTTTNETSGDSNRNTPVPSNFSPRSR